MLHRCVDAVLLQPRIFRGACCVTVLYNHQAPFLSLLPPFSSVSPWVFQRGSRRERNNPPETTPVRNSSPCPRDLHVIDGDWCQRGRRDGETRKTWKRGGGHRNLGTDGLDRRSVGRLRLLSFRGESRSTGLSKTAGGRPPHALRYQGIDSCLPEIPAPRDPRRHAAP